MRFIAITALFLVAACSAFTTTSKYSCHARSSENKNVHRFVTNSLLFKSNEINIRGRDSSLALSSGEIGDVSFVNVLFFLAVYSLGIYATVESSKTLEKKSPELSVDVPAVEEISSDAEVEEDVTQSADDTNDDQIPVIEDSEPSKNPLKRIFRSSGSTEVTKEVEPLKEISVEEQAEGVEPDAVQQEQVDEIEKIYENNYEPVEESTKEEKTTDFTDLKKQVASTANQYPDITETLIKVASTKESVNEKYRLLALNAETEKEESLPR